MQTLKAAHAKGCQGPGYSSAAASSRKLKRNLPNTHPPARSNMRRESPCTLSSNNHFAGIRGSCWYAVVPLLPRSQVRGQHLSRILECVCGICRFALALHKQVMVQKLAHPCAEG